MVLSTGDRTEKRMNSLTQFIATNINNCHYFISDYCYDFCSCQIDII